LTFRSFIASYLGNIIGALLVALPAVYFYLGDYNAGGLMKAERGEGSGSSSPHMIDPLVK
jgi:formate/nitrite transporter FocA (FNT family)